MRTRPIKIPGGALHYVIVVAVFIMILVMSFITWLYINQRLEVKALHYKDAIISNHQAFQEFSNSVTPYTHDVVTTAKENLNISTTMHRKHWGIFDLGTVTTTLYNEQFSRTALLGGQTTNPPAVYVSNRQMPLVLVGNATITGTAYLSEYGVKTGNIAGVSFYGNQLVTGELLPNEEGLPKIQNILKLREVVQTIPIAFENYPQQHTKRINPFSEPTQHYFSEEVIVLDQNRLGGNIIIQSLDEIIIGADTQLQHVICIAPKITISSGVVGSFQAIASAEIIVEENVVLSYPSALVLLATDSLDMSTKQTSHINIKAQSRLEGVVLYNNPSKGNSYASQVSLAPQTVVVGEVYNTHNTALQGTVYGTVYTGLFIAKQSGGTYINHLYNGQIIRTQAPTYFAGLQVSDNHLRIATWIE